MPLLSIPTTPAAVSTPIPASSPMVRPLSPLPSAVPLGSSRTTLPSGEEGSLRGAVVGGAVASTELGGAVRGGVDVDEVGMVLDVVVDDVVVLATAVVAGGSVFATVVGGVVAGGFTVKLAHTTTGAPSLCCRPSAQTCHAPGNAGAVIFLLIGQIGRAHV